MKREARIKSPRSPKFHCNNKSLLDAANKSRGSAVGIATGYGLKDREIGVRVPIGSSVSSSPYG
jgi:hypothetical protein